MELDFCGAGACLNPIKMKNPTLRAGQNNGGVIREELKMFEYVNIPCGWCAECRKKRARDWMIRLKEEMKYNKNNCYFITLTFSDLELELLSKKIKSTEANAIAIKAIKEWRERINRRRGKAMKRFMITERGSNGTERLHMHGIVWCESKEELKENLKLWRFGNTDIGYRCDSGTAAYIVKYMLKEDKRGFESIVLCSPGLGAEYVKNNKEKHTYRGRLTNTLYIDDMGRKMGLPTYYKKKLFTYEQRREMWEESMMNEVTIIYGTEYNKKDTEGIETARNYGRGLDRTKAAIDPERKKARKILENAEEMSELEINKEIKKAIKVLRKKKDEYEMVRKMREGGVDVDMNGEIITDLRVIESKTEFKETKTSENIMNKIVSLVNKKNSIIFAEINKPKS